MINGVTTFLSSDTFTVVSSDALTGVFGNVLNGARLVTTDGLGSFAVNYGSGSIFNPDDIVLSDLQVEANPAPEPVTWFLFAIGIVGLLWSGQRRRLKANSGHIVY